MTRSVLAQAAGILAVEGFHSGAIYNMRYDRRNEKAAAELTVTAVSKAISDFRDLADGPRDKDQGITEPIRPGDANIVLSDANAAAFSRLPRKVLNIVYLAPEASRGGFFPNGVNGLMWYIGSTSLVWRGTPVIVGGQNLVRFTAGEGDLQGRSQRRS